MDTIGLMLTPTPEQQRALDATFETFERAIRHAMKVGRNAGTTGNAVIHRLCYRELRDAFGLSANLTVRAIARAAQELKAPGNDATLDAIEYDIRIFSIDRHERRLSLSTVAGRLRDIEWIPAPGQRERLGNGRAVRAVLSRTRPDGYEFTILLA